MLDIQQAAYVWPIVRERQLWQPARKLQLRRAWTRWHFLCSNKETFLSALHFFCCALRVACYVAQQFGFIPGTYRALAVFNGGRLMLRKCQECCELPCTFKSVALDNSKGNKSFTVFRWHCCCYTVITNVCVFSRDQPSLMRWALSPECLPMPANPVWKVRVNAFGLQNHPLDPDAIMCFSWRWLMQIFWFMWGRCSAQLCFSLPVEKKEVKSRDMMLIPELGMGTCKTLFCEWWFIILASVCHSYFASDCVSLPVMTKASAGPLVSFWPPHAFVI